MLFEDPFVRLIVYLCLIIGAMWLLGVILVQMKARHPWTVIVPIVIGVILLIFAFRLSGLPIF